MAWLDKFTPDAFKYARLQRQCRKGALPDFVCDYLGQRSTQPGADSRWEALRFVVLDTETTGLNPAQDRILSIGAVAVVQGELVLADSLELMLQNPHTADTEAIEVHGIMPSESQSGIAEIEAVAAFLRHLRADVLVAHHTAFDAAMIEQVVRRAGAQGFALYNHRLDTAHLAQKLEHPGKSAEYINHSQYSLDALCARYDIAMADRHTAWGDAYITGLLLMRFLRMFRSRNHLQLRSLL
ncbi:MAG: 3'-5' exonuclease [Bacteroidia bacterium]